jgi:hypothetical protein
MVMAMEFWWEDETHTIMQMDIGLGTSWEEYHEVMDRLVCEVTAAEHGVYLIMQIMGNMPPGSPLPHLKLGIGKLGDIPNLSAVMVVGEQRMSVFGQKVIRLLVRLYGRDLPPNGGYYASLEEAQTAIARLRDSEKIT